jgi:Subtilase family
VDRTLNEVALDPTKNITQTFSQHATMVAGVMVAARNGEGGVGVAYNSTLAGHYIQGEGLEVNQLSLEITNALAKFKNYDVVNNSWGASNNFMINVVPTGTLEAGIKAAVEQGDAQKVLTTKSIACCAHSMPGRGRFDHKKQRQWINRSCVAKRSWRWSPQYPTVQSSELIMEGVAL